MTEHGRQEEDEALDRIRMENMWFQRRQFELLDKFDMFQRDAGLSDTRMAALIEGYFGTDMLEIWSNWKEEQ